MLATRELFSPVVPFLSICNRVQSESSVWVVRMQVPALHLLPLRECISRKVETELESAPWYHTDAIGIPSVVLTKCLPLPQNLVE